MTVQSPTKIVWPRVLGSAFLWAGAAVLATILLAFVYAMATTPHGAGIAAAFTIAGSIFVSLVLVAPSVFGGRVLYQYLASQHRKVTFPDWVLILISLVAWPLAFMLTA